MSRRLAGALLAAALVLVAGTAFWLFRRADRAPAGEPSPPTTTAPVVASPGEGVTLFFPGPDALLHAERRDLKLDGDVTTRARQLVEALLEGPQNPGLLPLLPAGTQLRHVLAGPPGVVYLDLQAPPDPQALAMGSRQELVSVYGVVDTVVLNVTGLRAVGFLWSGVQPASFAGHVDTTMPLVPDTSMVAEPPAATGGG